MKRTKVKVHVQHASIYMDDRIIMLGDAVMRRWKITPNQTVQLRFGSARHEVKVVSVAQSSSIRMSDSLASKLGVTNGKHLCLQYKSASRTLQLGPVIGVMISRVYGSADRPFGAITAFCREMSDACDAHGAFVFFFTPEDVTAHGDTVKGYTFGSRWTRGTFPVPNVIYNRLTSRKLENRPVVQQFIHHAKTQYNTGIFNEKYLNKNEVFDALKRETSVGIYLPESHLLRSSQLLKSMCTRYATVFLKPVTGSLGKGIIRIRKQEGGGYVCHATSMSGARKQTFGSLNQLAAALAGKIKLQRHQIQQGLNLISVDGRPVDFRALVQRDEAGQWGVTSIVARIAGSNHFVSNLARGGSLSQVGPALARSNSPSKTDALARLKRASLQIAKGIERQMTAHFAELGIDLAVDTSGRIWLLEVNSKPSKDDNTAVASNRKVRPSVKLMVRYARHLAKF